jgi:hypothetical protein
MEISLRQIEALNGAIQELLPLKLELSLAFQLASLAKEVHEAFNMLNIERTKIITKYAKKDENGQIIANKDNSNMIEIPDEDVKKVDAELDELFAKKIELKSEKIQLSAIKDLDLTVGQIEVLVPFIEK